MIALLELFPILLVFGALIFFMARSIPANRRAERFVLEIARSGGVPTTGSGGSVSSRPLSEGGVLVGDRSIALRYALVVTGSGVSAHPTFRLETAPALGVSFTAKRRPPGILGIEISVGGTVSCKTGDGAFDRAVYVRTSSAHSAIVSRAFASPQVRECVRVLCGLGLDVKEDSFALTAGSIYFSVPYGTSESRAAKVIPAFVRLAESLSGVGRS